MNYYKKTEPLIKLDTGIDLSSGSNPEIHYEKPDGSSGEWEVIVTGKPP